LDQRLVELVAGDQPASQRQVQETFHAHGSHSVDPINSGNRSGSGTDPPRSVLRAAFDFRLASPPARENPRPDWHAEKPYGRVSPYPSTRIVPKRSSIGIGIITCFPSHSTVSWHLRVKNALVPYGGTCARFARMFSGDMEGHAPSWPCSQCQRTRRSASLQYRYLVAAVRRFGGRILALSPLGTLGNGFGLLAPKQSKVLLRTAHPTEALSICAVGKNAKNRQKRMRPICLQPHSERARAARRTGENHSAGCPTSRPLQAPPTRRTHCGGAGGDNSILSGSC